ncbi:tetratricopeptide repeat protein [Pyxidicoccus parkwayensis]|uniref:Tetratricopeptide repeat protein n=1 Tax=Pyxidicoccus parkwayensis TaxID=2813578 RepID=A0ABX7NK70_9BACT|nr:tetratricopeptide repeat protein [Pyxidicoccus parkwaysis]QSQ18846.1 tetratricopeptide repeat protein [Pyxidicoccus parkwaysis]
MRHGFVMGALLALLASSQLACVVGPRFTRCPAEGGRPWVRLDSDHYTLETDLPPAEARKAMGALERTRVAILATLWPDALARPMPKVHVYVLADPDEFEGLYPRRVRAFFHRSETEALIVLPGPPDSWVHRFSGLSLASSSRLNHELSHFLSTYSLLRQPRWLSEGMAEFLETLRVSEDGKTAVVGAPHFEAILEMAPQLNRVVRTRPEKRSWSMRRVFDWDPSLEVHEDDRQVGLLYAASWLLVHWLYNEHPDALAAYQALLSRGMAPDEAERQALPELRSDTLDATLLNYLRDRRYPERTVPVPTVGSAFLEEVIEHAEVHAIRAKLAALGASMAHREPFIQNRRKLSRDELNEALRLDPKGLVALSTQLLAAPDAEKPAIARQAVEAHPNESESWLMLASALGTEPAVREEAEAAYKKALELEPRSAPAATGLAWLYVTQGRLAEALPLVQWAVSLAPWSTHALDTFAMVLAGGGACDEAIQTEERALELIQDEGNPEVEKVLRERLEGLSRGTLCTPATPQP